MALPILTVMTVAALLGIGAGLFWVKRRPASTALESLGQAAARHAAFIALALIGCGVLLAPLLSDDFCRRLPWLWQRNHVVIGWGSVCGGVAFTFALIGSVAVASRLRESEFLAMLLTVGLAVLGLQAGLRHREVVGALTPRVSSEGVVLQSHPVSCGAASLANLAQLHGTMLTEESAARLLGTTTTGTSRGQMRFALHQLGIPFEERNDLRLALAELPAPALLMVDHPAVGREGHMVMYAGRSETGYEIWDPLTGRVEWTEREARSRWHGRAFSCPRE